MGGKISRAATSHTERMSPAPRPPGMNAITTERQEWANVWTHTPGIILSLVGLNHLWAQARIQGTVWHAGGATLFGGALVLVYVASTAYHLTAAGPLKHWLKKLDHVGIYFLIAGTYSPFLLLNLRHDGGPTLLGVIWLLALGGMAWKVVCADCAPRVSTGTFIVLGWGILVIIGRLDAAMPEGGIHWLLAGGAAYSIGVIFYLWHRVPYHHAIWHIFVLAGSACHWVAVSHYSLVCLV